jgi:beta-galactosidase/beta-glucuronidase
VSDEVSRLHPRPQLTRPRWVDLCGPWGFAYDDDDRGVDEHWADRDDVFDRTIHVPFPPESPASGIGERGFRPGVWYRRTFRSPQRPGERLLLHFGAVDYRACVWVNGRLVAQHEGGHTPFSADVTPALHGEGEQVVVVRAEDRPADMTQPRGKQAWLERPHKVWYERTTGIWQPVWLEPVPRERVAALRWTPDLDRAVLCARVELAGDVRPGRRVRLRLELRGEVLADDTYAATGEVVQRDVALDPVRITQHRRDYLWSPDHPNLLDATVTLLEGDDVLDEVRSYVGLRSISTRAGRFVLNGRPFYLRMVLAQNYWPESHLAAPSPDALRREVELVKDLGFNGVRIHQKVEDPRFLYWCDRLGVAAWGELPSAMEYGPATVARLTREWLEVLERDASCPSLVTWVPFNESWGLPNLQVDPAQQHALRALYSLTKAVDPTRLVVGNDGWEHLVSDVFGVHDYSPHGDVLRERYGDDAAVARTVRSVQPFYRPIVLPELQAGDEPLMLTEFGGLTFDPTSQDFWNGYGAVASAEELLKRYEDLVSALLDSPVVAGFCYTQLTDTAQERNGLLDAQRRPKVPAAAVAGVNRRASASIPAETIEGIQYAHAAEQDAGEQLNP